MGRIRGILIAAATILVLGACATAGGAGGEETVVDIEVENTLSPPVSVTIWIVPELDPRELLGTVGPGEAEAFSYTAGAAGRYRLVAETTAGGDLLSRRFAIPGDVETVSWNMSTNTVHVQ